MFELPIEQQEFYRSCAKILGVEHEFSPRYSKRTRWNHRCPGNGRFPGHGTIRWFNRDNIYVSLHTPPATGRFSDTSSCLVYLSQLNGGS